ncbi:MAG: nickel-dependent hydrogenase large subunit [Halochromatium sp.]|uniref:nickel-dependent hydrogenase large subunit n=1 Tax=Halochromatium sp. TaxID=2049430 RepID=UPI00397A888E
MSALAGQLEIRLEASSGAVAIGSSRPLTAARVFAGKPPAAVVRQLPTLFSLCGTAQAAACVSACEQALDRQPSAAVLARRQALVSAETIKEHLWRLLLDWPRMLEPWAETMPKLDAGARIDANAHARASTEAKAPSPAASTLSAIEAKTMAPKTSAASAMPRVMRAFMALRRTQQAGGDPFSLHTQQAEQGAAAGLDPSALLDLVTEQALGTAPDAWLQALDSPAAVRRWAAQTRTPAAGLVRALLAGGVADCGANPVARLPAAPWQPLAEALANADADAFIATPRWQRECAETGPLARVAAHPLIAALLAEHGNGLLTRLVALLVDLAQRARGLEGLSENTALAAPEAGNRLPRAGFQKASETTLDAGMEDRGGAVQASLEDAGESLRPVVDGTGARGRLPGLKNAVDRDETRGGVDAGVGIGAAEAARGLLVHRVSIADGRVERYRILAPTEWNFHPAGVVAQGLAAIARGGAKGPELERLARLYITAVDPCVDYQLSVS